MIETRFKQTEIGPIPEDWEVTSVKSSCLLVGNNTFSRDMMSESGNVMNIHYGDVLIKYGCVTDVNKDVVPFIKLEIRDKAKFNLENGDIIIADTAEDNTVGKATEVQGLNVKSQIEAGLHTIVVRPKEKFIPAFLGYFVNSSVYHNQLLSYIQGIKVSSISRSAILSTFILRPEIREQQQIASALSDIDSLIEALYKLIAKKEAVKRGAMQQLLTGRKRLPGFSDPWGEKNIGDVLSIGNGRDYRHLQKGNVPVYGSGGIIEFVNEYLYDGETVCIGRKGTIDHPTYFNGKIWTVDTLFYTHSFIDVSPKFIYYLFHTIDWLSYNEATGVPSLSKVNILQIKILIPCLEEQRAIAGILTDMDNEIEALRQKKEKYEKIRQGMMQQLLTGRIRLIDPGY